MNTVEQNKAIVRKLIEQAFPQGDLAYMRQVVAKEAVTHRAGFAALYRATGASIPPKGNLLQWVEQGWSQLQQALGEQTVEVYEVIGEGNQVMIRFHMTALHKGEFAGAKATHRRVEWDEIASIRFGDDGKISDLWFMCEEMRLASEIGYVLSHQEG
ncbi:ester cyclase [Volucribacter amazonae]|uniref:SnoaL-like polyketide cyclase n=1 Tax=Volucribacter amazonae TaxID=256731 RepID=A0A9X4PBS0_9PAST|nr:ester cyclase [Volucribacter amazonae]MDG6895357.1 hypothetical protein [Volucribacter amazonae]